MTIPMVFDIPNTRAKTGMTVLFNRMERNSAARGAEKSTANATRQSCFGFFVIASSNNPNHGASRNQLIKLGKKAAPIRGRYVMFVSPCVKKPMYVRMAMAITSPMIRVLFFIFNLYVLL